MTGSPECRLRGSSVTPSVASNVSNQKLTSLSELSYRHPFLSSPDIVGLMYASIPEIPNQRKQFLNYWYSTLSSATAHGILSQSQFSFERDGLEESLTLNGLVPMSLTEVLQELVADGRLRGEKSQWGWLGEWLSWFLGTRLSGRLIVDHLIKKVVQHVQRTSTDQIFTIETFAEEYSLNKEDAQVVLDELIKQKTVVAHEETHPSGDVVLMLRVGDKPIKEWEAKHYLMGTDTAKIEEEVTRLESEIERTNIEIRTAIRGEKVAKNQRRAINMLKKRKRLESQLKERSSQLENLHDVLDRISSGSSQAQIVQILEQGTQALSDLNRAMPIGKVDNMMDDLAELMGDTQMVGEAISTPINKAEEEELEKELQRLAAEEALEQAEQEGSEKLAVPVVIHEGNKSKEPELSPQGEGRSSVEEKIQRLQDVPSHTYHIEEQSERVPVMEGESVASRSPVRTIAMPTTPQRRPRNTPATPDSLYDIYPTTPRGLFDVPEASSAVTPNVLNSAEIPGLEPMSGESVPHKPQPRVPDTCQPSNPNYANRPFREDQDSGSDSENPFDTK